MEMKKGQSALEYLVTYGWAILAIVIIAALLVASGIFNPSTFASSNVCKEGASVSCDAASSVYYANGTILLSLGNKVGSTISNVYAVNGTYNNATVQTLNALCTTSLAANGKATCSATLGVGTRGNAYDEVAFLVNFTSGSGVVRTDTVRLKGLYN